jgi:hypothetical protein
MSNEKKKPAKKAPAKKAVAKKTAPAKKAPAKKAPAKKQVAKPAPVKRQAPVVNVVSRQATSTTPADITMSVSGATSENTTTHTIINNVVRANDVQTASLRKRMLRWFSKK